MANTIGTAYVQVEPSFNGVVSKIDKEFGGAGAKSGKSFSTGFASVVGNAAGTVGTAIAGLGKIAVGASAAGTAAVGALAKSAIDAYSNYEQLEGGTKLLFGDSWSTVMGNADSAFARVQMSANDYLQQANSYATGLKESLGGDTEAAANLADSIMVAQADIVAATGNSQEAVQNAFNGIMKSNFSMLDNLQLGIKPTKEGMQEVIDKMNEWNATQGKTTKYQMGNLADMQSAIVDYVSYVGMAGYAQEEASGTIQGSLASMKAAWENTLTAISQGDDWDIGVYVSNLTSTISTFVGNIMPVIEKSLTGISELITQLAPIIADEVPKLITAVAPQFIQSGIQLVGALVQGILENIPQITFAAFDIIEMLFNSLLDATSGESGTIMEIINWIFNIFEENYTELMDIGVQILMNIGEGILEGLPELLWYCEVIFMHIIDLIINNIPQIITTIVQLISMIAERLSSLIPVLVPAIVQGIIVLAQAIIQNLPILLNALLQIMQALAQGLIDALPILMDALPGIIVSLVMFIIENGPMFVQTVFDIIGQMAAALIQAGVSLLAAANEFFSGLVQNVKAWLAQLPERMAYFAGQMVGKFITFLSQLPGKIQSIWNSLIDKLKDFGTKFVNYAKSIPQKFKDFFTTTLAQLPSKMLEIGKNIVDGLLEGIKNAWNNLTGAVGQLVDSFLAGVKDQLKIGSPSKVMADEIGRWIPAGIAEGIENGMGVLDSAMDDVTVDLVSKAQVEDISNRNTNVVYSAANNQSDNAVATILSSYLPAILQAAENGKVVLSPDAQGIFKIVRDQNRIMIDTTGYHALA